MNIKKVMHKDRHGAQVSVEFEQGQGANPKALGVLQEFFQAAIPQMGGVPEHPGEPKGTDTVPAWLTPGEFVMNAEATRMFEPQIEAMNDAGRAVQAAQGGSIPEYKNDGGIVGQLLGNVDNSLPPQSQLINSALALGATPEQLQAVLRVPVNVQDATQAPYNIPYGDEFLSEREMSEKLTAPYYESSLPSNFVPAPATPQAVPQVKQAPEGMMDTYTETLLDDAINDGMKRPNYVTPYPTREDAVPKPESLEMPSEESKPELSPMGTYGMTREEFEQRRGPRIGDVKRSDISPPGTFQKAFSEAVLPDNETLIQAGLDGTMPPEAVKRELELRALPDVPDMVLSTDINPLGTYGMTREEFEQERERISAEKEARSAEQERNKRAKDLTERRERAQTMGLEGEVKKIDKQLEELTTPKAIGDTQDTNSVVDAGAKAVGITAEYTMDDILDMAGEGQGEGQGGGKGKSGGFGQMLRDAFGWIRETLGGALEGVIEPDELKKMALFYIGSRSFGNSHEGTLNWLGTRFIADMDRHQAMVDKLTASGKYTSGSIETFNKTKNLNDLIPTSSVPAYTSSGTKQRIMVNGLPVSASPYKDQTGAVVYKVPGVDQPIPASAVELESDYRTRMKVGETAVEKAAKSYLETKILGDDAEEQRNRFPDTDTIARDIARYADQKGVDVLQTRGVLNNILTSMQRDLADPRLKIKELDGDGVVRAYLTDELVQTTANSYGNLLFEKGDPKQSISSYTMQNVYEPMRETLKRNGKAFDPIAVANLANHFAKKYESELSEEQRQGYVNKANDNQSGFYVYLRETFKS